MGIIDRLFGRKSQQAAAPVKTREEIQAECSHTALLGRWDSVEDMGKEEKAVRFICDSCHAEFSPEQTQEIREGHAELLRQQFEREEAEAAEAEAEEAARKAEEETTPQA